MTDTQKPFSDELLSAYLDGELSDSQKVEVGKALEAQPDLRKLHEELCAIRDGLQAMPQQAAPPHLTEAVLNRVRAAANTNGETPIGKSQDHSLAPARNGGWQRGIVWSVFVIATALLVMFFLPGNKGDQPRVSKNLEESDRVKITSGEGTPVDNGTIAAPAEDSPPSEDDLVPEQPANPVIGAARESTPDADSADEPRQELSSLAVLESRVDHMVRLDLSEEDVLRQLGAKQVKLVSRHLVKSDVVSNARKQPAPIRALLVEGPRDAIEALTGRPSAVAVPSVVDVAEADAQPFVGAARQKDERNGFALALDLDADLRLEDSGSSAEFAPPALVKRYRRSKAPAAEKTERIKALLILE